MVSAKEIYDYLDTIAPFDTAMDFDNAGLLVGDEQTVSNKVLVALDATSAVIREAARLNASIVITHHPIIFDPLRVLDSRSAPYLAALYGITVVSAHTNLDIAVGGVNDTLAEAIGVIPCQRFDKDCALLGELEKEMTCRALAAHLKERLRLPGLRYADMGVSLGNKEWPIRRVLVSCGAGGSNVPLAIKCGARAIVTGEIKHHQILLAQDYDIAVLDLGHFGSEDCIIPKLVRQLRERFNGTEFLQAETDTDGIRYL